VFLEESGIEATGASMKFSTIWLSAILAASPGFGQSSTQQMTAGAAARFLDQATWGPTPASIAQLQQKGISNWLSAQFALNTSNIADQPQLDSTGQPNRDLHPVQAAFFQNTLTGQDQLRQRVAFALSQIWVVSFSGLPIAYAYPPYWRIFRDNAFGNYRDLIRAVTLSPAMGRYLNMANNNKGNPAKNTSANENYARELMQLFTLGLTQLNPNGTPVLDQNQNPIPTYDQAVVTNMAKVVTGWTYPTVPGAKPKKQQSRIFLRPDVCRGIRTRHQREDDLRKHHDPRRADGGTGPGFLVGRFDGPAHPGDVCFQAIDSTSGDQQSQPAIYCACVERVSERWQWKNGRYARGYQRDSHRPGSASRRRYNGSANQRDVRPHARAGAIHAQSFAGLECHADRE
jgi:hypothetical protein